MSNTGASFSVGFGCFAATQTIAVPATRFTGWLGFTTQVSLLTAEPFLLPAHIVSGTVIVGIPMWKLSEYESTWMHIGQSLGVKFGSEDRWMKTLFS